MSKRQIKLGALTMGSGGPGRHNLWLDPELPADASVNIDWYLAIARQAEAALFDLMFIVDSQFITPGSPSHYLNRLEPLTRSRLWRSAPAISAWWVPLPLLTTRPSTSPAAWLRWT